MNEIKSGEENYFYNKKYSKESIKINRQFVHRSSLKTFP